MQFPLPRLDDCLEGLQGNCIFGALDLRKGFHQIPLTTEAAKLTAFRTPQGIFQYNSMPFGLVNAPSYFQQVMTDVFQGLLGKHCIVYIDDIIVFGKNIKAFIQSLVLVLERINLYSLSLNRDKCYLGMRQIEFLGFLISEEGRTISPDRVVAIRKIPSPRSKKEVRSFLGLVNFVRDFIPQCASVCHDLYTLTEKDAEFLWTSAHQQSFEKIKELVAGSATLAFPTGEGELRLFTDASDVGIGGVLVQVSDTTRPIAFVSKALNPTQRRWSVYEKEGWAIIYCIKKLDYYLRGRKFTLFTDHRNLTFLERGDNAKITRWMMFLMDYSFTIVHVSGANNGAADCLSRLGSRDLAFKSVRIKLAYDTENKLFQDLMILQKKYPLGPEDKHTIDDLGLIILPSGFLYIPEDVDFRMKCIEFAHASLIGGHCGINATLRKLKQWRILWTNIKKDISGFVHNCLVCQRERLRIEWKETKGCTFVDKPFYSVAVDTIGPFPESRDGNKYGLSFIDSFTRYIEIFPTKTAKAEEAASILYHEYILRFGVPEIIKSDNGKQFVNSLWEHLLKWLDISHRKTTVYNPQSNGIVERSNRELLKFLRALIGEGLEPEDWDKNFPLIRFLMNNQEHTLLGVTPFEMVYGRRADEVFDLFRKEGRKDITEVSQECHLGSSTAKKSSIEYIQDLGSRLDMLKEKVLQIQEQKRKKNDPQDSP
ncbi:Transposon Tf2-6 polyprotein, partial [Aduncisulcus paluster]